MKKRIIKVAALDNGGHYNTTGTFASIPEGWAVVPDDLTTENFPFGEVEVEEIDGVLTVTKWTPGEIPEVPEPEQDATLEKRVDEMAEALDLLLSGVTE